MARRRQIEQRALRRQGMNGLAIPLAAALTLVAGTAAATQQAITAEARWKVMDVCAKQAQAAFPDFTADSNAKRDAALNQCLESNNLPPRQPEMPAQPR
jgi:hypothetical protein